MSIMTEKTSFSTNVSPWDPENYIVSVEFNLDGDGSGNQLYMKIDLDDEELFTRSYHIEMLGFTWHTEASTADELRLELPQKTKLYKATYINPAIYMRAGINFSIAAQTRYSIDEQDRPKRPIYIGLPDGSGSSIIYWSMLNVNSAEYELIARFLCHKTPKTLKPWSHYYWL